jgi:maltodextrin utilization protein YvdJ
MTEHLFLQQLRLVVTLALLVIASVTVVLAFFVLAALTGAFVVITQIFPPQ